MTLELCVVVRTPLDINNGEELVEMLEAAVAGANNLSLNRLVQPPAAVGRRGLSSFLVLVGELCSTLELCELVRTPLDINNGEELVEMLEAAAASGAAVARADNLSLNRLVPPLAAVGRRGLSSIIGC